jgi:neutral trehalase
LFSKQREDGKLSLAAQPGIPPGDDDDTQPPIIAWSLCHQNERTTRTDLIAELYPSLMRYLEWFETHRKNETGLYGWRVRTTEDAIRAARGGESGMDNSPRFDHVTAITAVDLSSYMASEYFSLEKLARCLERAGDVQEWRQRRTRITDLVNRLLWDDETRFYYDLDEHGEFVAIKTTAGLMPLLGQIPDRDQAESLRMHLLNPNEFWSEFPAASVSQDERSFSYDMWRGPTWPNVNVLLYYGLMAYGFFQEARALARATVNEIVRCYLRHGCFYEYYDATAAHPPAELPRKGAPGAKGGVGFGVVEDFHWTAAAFVHFVHELH